MFLILNLLRFDPGLTNFMTKFILASTLHSPSHQLLISHCSFYFISLQIHKFLDQHLLVLPGKEFSVACCPAALPPWHRSPPSSSQISDISVAAGLWDAMVVVFLGAGRKRRRTRRKRRRRRREGKNICISQVTLRASSGKELC